jgi:hypothetical protein
MSIVGTIINLCSAASVTNTLCAVNACRKTGWKIIDKVMIPVGTYFVASYVGDKVEEHAEKKIEEFKDAVNGIKELGKLRRELAEAVSNDVCCDSVVHNVFEDQDVEETEEVTDNGNS